MTLIMNTLEKLRELHLKYRRKYQGNSNAEQMCCMWSTYNPPSDIYCTDQIYSIEEAFNIELSEDEALDIYDMDTVDAAKTIDMMIIQQSNND